MAGSQVLRVEREIRELLQERQEIRQTIQELSSRTKSRRFTRPPVVNTSKHGDDANDKTETPTKRSRDDDDKDDEPPKKKLLSVVSAGPNTVISTESKSPTNRHVDLRPKIVEDEGTRKRNKALLARGLLGHLASAKKRLENDRESSQTQRMKEKEERVVRKLANAQNNFAELRRQEAEDKRDAALLALKKLDKEIAKKDMELLRNRLEQHYRRVKNFIRTSTEPAIYWLPSKHNDITRNLLKDTEAIIDKKLNSLQFEIQPPPEGHDEGELKENLSEAMEDDKSEDEKEKEKKEQSDGEVDEDEMQDILAAADA